MAVYPSFKKNAATLCFYSSLTFYSDESAGFYKLIWLMIFKVSTFCSILSYTLWFLYFIMILYVYRHSIEFNPLLHFNNTIQLVLENVMYNYLFILSTKLIMFSTNNFWFHVITCSFHDKIIFIEFSLSIQMN